MSIQTIAIVIGISYYLDDIPSIPACEIDAVNLARGLKNWGIPEENILLLLNEDGNKQNVDHFFHNLEKIKENYKLVFYFCGHGFRTLSETPKSYLILHDCSFSLDSFIEKIAKMNILESYVLIDACHLRINTFINPKLEEEARGKIRSDKSLFCLLSSGIEESYESVNGRYGYFTKALLTSLSYMRQSEGSPTEFLLNIQNQMIIEDLPPPDMVNFGNQKIAFIPNTKIYVDSHHKINRYPFIAEIQDALIQHPDKIIFLFGEEGSGKTTICESLASEKMKTYPLKIPPNIDDSFDPLIFLDTCINKKFHCCFDEFENRYPYYLIILDQLEKLNAKQMITLFKRLYRSILRFICVSRLPLEDSVKNHLDFLPLTLETPPLSKEEARVLIRSLKPDCTDENLEFAYLISKGNPLKIKKILLLDNQVDLAYLNDIKKAIAAVYSCAAYYDQNLFEKIFDLQKGILNFLESVQLILRVEESYIPHPFLNSFAESKSLHANTINISTYWYEQAKLEPTHQGIAQSLILSVKCFGYEKSKEKILNRAFHTLNINQKFLNYFIDGAEIFLSLSFRTKTTVFLAKALKTLGEDALSNKLLEIGKYKVKQKAYAISCFFLVFIIVFSYAIQVKPLNPSVVHIKQVHPDFVGRENYMDLLEKHLITNHQNNSTKVAVLWGDGGVGKSEIAVSFANKHLKDFDLIHWMDSATEESYMTSYQHLAKQLNISFQEKESIDKIVRKVHDYLENQNPFNSWLLIFDNTEKEYELPERGNGSIIITTRNHTDWRLQTQYEVLPFTENEALSLFKKITQKDKTLPQLSIIKELENHPLALNLAAHYISETPLMSEVSYLELLFQNKVNLLDSMSINCRYPYGLINSWKMTAERLHKKHSKSLEWLHFCSYLYPDRIPSSWIEEWLTQFFPDYKNSDSLKIETNEILRLIVNQALMRCDTKNQTLSLHRLKQEIFQYDDYFDSKTKNDVLNFLVDSFKEFERTDAMERAPEIWPKLKQWELHAVWFLDKHSNSCEEEQVALLNNLIGNWKTVKGEPDIAESYIHRALDIRLKLFGQEDLRTIITMNNKAWNLLRLGKFKESKAIYLQALASLKNIVEDQHPYMTFIMNNLTLILKELKEYVAMKEIASQVLKIRMQTYGLENPYTADSLHNLATAHWKLEEYDEAQKYFKEALGCYRLCYNENHPYIAITMHSLARVSDSKKDYQEAESLFIESLKLYKKLYGLEHPYSAYCLQNYAQMLLKAGREKEAFSLFKEALVNLKKIYNQDHYLIVSVLEDLKSMKAKASSASIALEIEELLE